MTKSRPKQWDAHKTTHGMSRSVVYKIYWSMRQRCENPNSTYYNNYGGRGITICPEWGTFEGFYADVGDPPGSGYTLDRRDNSRGYSKSNCRWATPKEQANNRRNNRMITCNGMTLTLAQWADDAGLRPGTLRERLCRGWPIEKAISHPVGGSQNEH